MILNVTIFSANSKKPVYELYAAEKDESLIFTIFMSLDGAII